MKDDRLLKDSSPEVRALLEPFTSRLAQMNTTRMATRVWSGLFGGSGSGGGSTHHFGSGGGGGGGDTHGVGVSTERNEWGRSPTSALSADVWTTTGESLLLYYY